MDREPDDNCMQQGRTRSNGRVNPVAALIRLDYPAELITPARRHGSIGAVTGGHHPHGALTQFDSHRYEGRRYRNVGRSSWAASPVPLI
jgi:hypothetical protein